MVSVMSASRYVTSSKKILDVHPRSDSTEFHGIGQGKSDWAKSQISSSIILW